MQIYGPYRVSTAQSTSNIHSASRVDRSGGVSQPIHTSPTTNNNGPIDQLDLSHAATSINRVENQSAVAGEGIRFERVAELRRQIADGSYDSPERMNAALDRLLDMWG